MLAWSVTSAVCAAALAVMLLRTQHDAEWPVWKLLLCTLLVVPGQVFPLPLLWLAWQHMYFVIPFLGPPVRVGVPAVGWACVAVSFSYAPAIVYACSGRWRWTWVLLHPGGSVRLLWREWKNDSNKRARLT
jgi:hypothetical protein